MSFKGQLWSLIKEAHKYQYVSISDSEEDIKYKKPRLYFTKVQWGLIVFSSLVAYLMQEGFDDSFAGYVVAGLSLFAGLFFSFVLMLLDNFQKIDFEPFKKKNNANLMPFGVRLKNYYKKSTALSFYIILLSLLCVFLLSLSLFNISINLAWISSSISIVSQIFFIGANVVRFLYRATTIYFLLDFLWITLYLIVSFYDYVGSEYDKVKLK